MKYLIILLIGGFLMGCEKDINKCDEYYNVVDEYGICANHGGIQVYKVCSYAKFTVCKDGTRPLAELPDLGDAE